MVKKSVEERYQKLSHREHILQRPGMYIGSVENEPKKTFVVENIEDIKNIKFVNKTVNLNPGFLKIFDESLVNASDHSIRTGEVKYIKVTVEPDHIIVENDGPGIPIQIHKEHKIYVPELIFGHLLSGENFDDSEERIVGGLHGMGVKLSNIYSKKFIIETADGKKKYKQEFLNNLEKTGKPKITACTKNYTKIIIYPDFEKFGMSGITEETQQILLKRVVDVSVYCPKVKVYYNGNLIPMKSFKDYMKMYSDGEAEMFYEKINDFWEIGVMGSKDDTFQQVSMVNGIATTLGGTHVNYITNLVVNGVKETLEKKHKKITIKPYDIKNRLFVFVNAKIVNPTFDTQTKENLTTRLTQQHVAGVEVSDKLIKSLVSSNIVEDILTYIEIKEKAELQKLNKGKVSRVKIKKLDDANMAGTGQSEKCVLFLAEGDSAAGTVLTGFASTGRDYYGCFPLKGKPLNVRGTAMAKIKENDEIKHIITALGLEFGKHYTSTKELRYGKVVFASDADTDGAHIRGLLINIFDTFWPELLKMDFIYDFVSPIIKIEKGKTVKYFYKLDEYRKWKELGEKGWSLTYYKGLGTIEPHEIKDFFKKLNKHLVRFNYTSEEETSNCIDLAFNDKRANDRKEWLLGYISDIEVDKFGQITTYKSFFDQEFIQFSMADNIRSIPSVMDGLKPSQRKILYTMFKNNYKEKIKVSNLSGAVIEKSSYHHGNQSIEGAVVGMAQNFINTNNINILEPLGNYGNRLGKGAASSRYIFTKLAPIARYIYKEVDDHVLEYLNDDGTPIEPKYYTPIIPMSLVNGSEGIGTGWSTFVPKFNPKDLVKYLVGKLSDKKTKLDIRPYYRGFKGEILFNEENNRYITRGVINKVNMSTLKITELPIGMWNDKYYDTLDKMIEKGIIKDYSKNDTDTEVNITINITREKLKDLEESGEDMFKLFSLETYLSMGNLILWDVNGKIRRYESVYEVLDEFYDNRIIFYGKRKDYLLDKLNREKNIIQNRMKFINAILKGSIKLNNVKREEVEEELIKMELDKVDDSFNYLLNMPLVSLTNEKLLELKELGEKKKEEIKKVSDITLNEMWLEDLKELVPFLK